MATASNSNNKKQLIERRGFKQPLDNIKLARQSYSGGLAYVSMDNLFTHPRELANEYTDRLKRAYFLNYSAPIVDSYCFFLSKEKVQRNIADNLQLQAFVHNCDLEGTSIDEFFKTIAVSILVSGGEFIVVDCPAINTETQADELMTNKRPYLYTIKTEDVLDFKKDDEGFVWIKFKTTYEAKDSWDYEGEGTIPCYVVWDRQKYTVYDMEGEKIQNMELVNEFGFVPIVHVKFGESLIKDICVVNRALFNWCSLLDENLYKQTFSWLTLPGDPNESLRDKQIGTSWAFTFDKDSKHPPKFISPDANQSEVFMKNINANIKEIYRLASLDNSSIGTNDYKSGTSKQYDFMNVNKTLAKISYALQTGEINVFSMINKVYGKNKETASGHPDGVEIQYPTEFNQVALMDRLEQLYEAVSSQFSKTFRKRAASAIVATLFPLLSEEDSKTIEKEIMTAFDSGLMDQLNEQFNAIFGPEAQLRQKDAQLKIEQGGQATEPQEKQKTKKDKTQKDVQKQ